MLTILEGSTFCICDDRGDIGGETSGLFASDTRFLSGLRLTINGEAPLLLSSNRVEYFSAVFYLRNPITDGLAQDTLLIARERFVGQGMEERVVITNETPEPVELRLAISFEADFADMFTVKEHDFALGHPLLAHALPEPRPPAWDADGNQFLFRDASQNGWQGTTQVVLSRPGEAYTSTTSVHSCRGSSTIAYEIVPSATSPGRESTTCVVPCQPFSD